MMKTTKNRKKPKQMDRDELLVKLSGMLEEMYHKVMYGKVRDKQVFQTKVASLRAFSYGCSVAGSLIKDQDLNAINNRLDALEEGE